MNLSGRLLSLGALALLGSLLSGCPTTTDPPTKHQHTEPRVEDEWAGIQKTAEWLYATRDFSGKRLDECVEVLKWVRGEEKCKGALCIHARDLTREWQARCPKIADKGEVEHDDVEDLLGKYEARAKDDPTPCGAEADSMLKNGCGKDKTCQATAESWGTRCGKSDGTPLVVRMIERYVERKLPEPRRVTLDTRSCDEMQGELTEAIACQNTFACEESLKKLNSYRARCEANGARPTAVVASRELAILDKAGQPPQPIPLQPGSTFSPKETPTALLDGLGMIQSVCDVRASTLEEYMAARRSCQGGKMVVVGITKEQGDPRARLGRLDVPTDAVLLARLPWMVAAGEAELREKQALAALGPELTKVGELAAKSPGDAIGALLKVLAPYRVLLRKSAVLRKSIEVRDDDLAPLFRELGKRKQAALKGRIERPMYLGFVTRTRERLLADVTEAGAVELGAAGPFDWLETADMLPHSTAAALESMKNAQAQAKVIRVDKRTADMAKNYAAAQIQACGDASKGMQEAQRGLIKCALGVDPCDDEKSQALGKQSDEARGKIDEARHQIDLVATGPGAPLRGELNEAVTAAGCAVPWW